MRFSSGLRASSYKPTVSVNPNRVFCTTAWGYVPFFEDLDVVNVALRGTVLFKTSHSIVKRLLAQVFEDFARVNIILWEVRERL